MASAVQCHVVRHIEPLIYTDGHKTIKTMRRYYIVQGEWLYESEVVDRYGPDMVDDAPEVFHEPALIFIDFKEESWQDCLQRC